MRIFFLLTILISCASPQVKPAENERSAELASENPLELKYNMKMLEGAPKMFLSMYDRDRGTDFLETETVEVISGPIALDVLQKYGAVPASDFEAELLKRSDSKVAYVKLNRGDAFPNGFIWVFYPENMKPESGVPGSFQVLGIKYLSSKEPAGEDLPLVNLPAFKEIPAVGLFAIAVVSEDCGNTPSFHRALSNAKVPVDGSFVFIDGFSEEGTAALKPFIGGPTVPSVLVFGNGKLIDYVESSLSADNIKHLLYRNNFVKADPGLNRRWKKEIDRKDIVRSLSWNINLSGTDLSDLDLRGAFFSALFFSGADFSNSDLRDANFNGARLNYASFKGANLKGATFEGAIWGETICPNGTLSDDSKNGTCFP